MTTMISKRVAIPARKHKRILKERGWSYRDAAPLLHVGAPHLFRVLKGERKSDSLLARIEKLPKREEVAQ